MKCGKCGWKWESHSARLMLTCPSCGHKVKNENAKFNAIQAETDNHAKVSYDDYCAEYKEDWDEDIPFPTKEEYDSPEFWRKMNETPTERMARLAKQEAELRKEDED